MEYFVQQLINGITLGSIYGLIAIAELSDSKFLMTKRAVKVTIGGCGG